MLSNKAPYGKQGANKHYIGYISNDFRPLCIIIKEIKLYTDHMNILADNKEFSKYTEIWNKIVNLFYEKFNKRGLYNNPTHNNEHIKTKISPYNENFHGNKKHTKDKYYGNSILLIESICKVKNEHYPKPFLDKLFEKHNSVPSSFKELVQITDYSDDDNNNN